MNPIKIQLKPALAQINAMIEVDVNGNKTLEEVHICNIEWDKFQRMVDAYGNEGIPIEDFIGGHKLPTGPKEDVNFVEMDSRQLDIVQLIGRAINMDIHVIVIRHMCETDNIWSRIDEALNAFPHLIFKMDISENRNDLKIRW